MQEQPDTMHSLVNDHMNRRIAEADRRRMRHDSDSTPGRTRRRIWSLLALGSRP
jgi:hypothetical protein